MKQIGGILMSEENILLCIERTIMFIFGATSCCILFSILKNRKNIFNIDAFKEKMQINKFKYFMNTLEKSDIYQDLSFKMMHNDDFCSLERPIIIEHEFEQHQIYSARNELLF